MTHTLHRLGTDESILKQDFVLLTMPSKDINHVGSAPKLRRFFEIALDSGARVAGVFTRNRFCAAPVTLSKSHLARHRVRAMVVNTGCANAGTGDEGLERAMQVCRELAGLLDCDAENVLPFSRAVRKVVGSLQ